MRICVSDRSTFLPFAVFAALAALAVSASSAHAIERYSDDWNALGWESMAYTEHIAYQAVNASGGSAYAGGFPVRMIGVVLNANEDWLDPSNQFDSGFHSIFTVPGAMGGQAEIYVQAVNLDGTPWDPSPSADFDDFGGTAVWIGQNYGNHPVFHAPDGNNYKHNYPGTLVDQTSQNNLSPTPLWYDEVDALGFWRPGSSLSLSELVRPGDLIEIRATGGLYYNGKQNINERHDVANDFALVILEKDFGLPAPTPVSLAELVTAGETYSYKGKTYSLPLFDATRQTGPEYYQSTLVTLENVHFVDMTEDAWQAYTENAESDVNFTLADDLGNTFPIHLGRNASFDLATMPTGSFNVTGILDQTNTPATSGYRLMVMSADAFAPVPEPSTLAMLGVLVFAGVSWARRSTRRPA
ncbi:MAG: DUF5689 domain-containing protein [Planctomycetota bacterium]